MGLQLSFSLLIFLSLTACQTKGPKVYQKPVPREILDCRLLEPRYHFNALRIKMTQDHLNSYIQQQKIEIHTPQVSQDLVTLEQIRRRVTAPLLSYRLSSVGVTKILIKELTHFKTILESGAAENELAKKKLEEISTGLLAKIEDAKAWSCDPLPPETSAPSDGSQPVNNTDGNPIGQGIENEQLDEP